MAEYKVEATMFVQAIVTADSQDEALSELQEAIEFDLDSPELFVQLTDVEDAQVTPVES